jgi:hypothetical protein
VVWLRHLLDLLGVDLSSFPLVGPVATLRE